MVIGGKARIVVQSAVKFSFTRHGLGWPKTRRRAQRHIGRPPRRLLSPPTCPARIPGARNRNTADADARRAYEGFHQHALLADGRAIDFYRRCNRLVGGISTSAPSPFSRAQVVGFSCASMNDYNEPWWRWSVEFLLFAGLRCLPCGLHTGTNATALLPPSRLQRPAYRPTPWRGDWRNPVHTFRPARSNSPQDSRPLVPRVDPAARQPRSRARPSPYPPLHASDHARAPGLRICAVHRDCR